MLMNSESTTLPPGLCGCPCFPVTGAILPSLPCMPHSLHFLLSFYAQRVFPLTQFNPCPCSAGSVCLDVINQCWSPMYDLINIFDVFLPQLVGSAGLLNLAIRLRCYTKQCTFPSSPHKHHAFSSRTATQRTH